MLREEKRNTRGDLRNQEDTNRRHVTGDHHGRTAGKATLLVRAVDEIFGRTGTRSLPGWLGV